MTPSRFSRLAAFGCTIAVIVPIANAQPQTPGNPQAGRAYALKNCGSCHMVSARQSPPSGKAPSFQAIADLPSTTAISLHAFLSTPHAKMPNFIVRPSDADDVIAYILSLRK